MKTLKYIIVISIVVLLLGFVTTGAHAVDVTVSYLYKLSNFSGTVPYSGGKLSVDRDHNEVYAIYQNDVRVYNEAGMEVYRFGDNPEYGTLRDLVTDENGDLYLLTYDLPPPEGGTDLPEYFILHCDYRGRPGKRITVTDLPPEYSHLHPHLLFYLGEQFLLVDRIGMLAVRVDKGGNFIKGFDFNRLLEIPEKDRPDTEIFGFNLDGRGNMLLTIPVLFQAYVVSPDGASVASFGKAGSGPGKFGIVTGIASDDHGNYLVSDSLRSVVMVFDSEFKFLTEFGYYGGKPENLIRPKTLDMGSSGKLYVTQAQNKGISVFSVNSSGSGSRENNILPKGGGEETGK